MFFSLLLNENLPVYRNTQWANAGPRGQGIQGPACPASPEARGGTAIGQEWSSGS